MSTTPEKGHIFLRGPLTASPPNTFALLGVKSLLGRDLRDSDGARSADDQQVS